MTGRPVAPPARPVRSGGGGGGPRGRAGACRTVSIGLQVLVGSGAGAWAAEGAGLRAAGSRTERGLRSGRGISRRLSPKPRASCSRRRCASPGPPRRQGPRARPPPAPRGLPGLGRSQVRSSSRGPRCSWASLPPHPAPRPLAHAESGAPIPPPGSPKAFPRGGGPARHGVGTGFERRCWLQSFVRSGWGRGPGPGRGLASREEVEITYLSLVNPGPGRAAAS